MPFAKVLAEIWNNLSCLYGRIIKVFNVSRMGDINVYIIHSKNCCIYTHNLRYQTMCTVPPVDWSYGNVLPIFQQPALQKKKTLSSFNVQIFSILCRDVMIMISLFIFADTISKTFEILEQSRLNNSNFSNDLTHILRYT